MVTWVAVGVSVAVVGVTVWVVVVGVTVGVAIVAVTVGADGLGVSVPATRVALGLVWVVRCASVVLPPASAFMGRLHADMASIKTKKIQRNAFCFIFFSSL
jgi:hypothetical protein